MNVIDFFLTGKGRAIYEPTTIESACLQVRKILELIAFGSLIANKDVYSAAYEQFAGHWHAARLLRDLETVNPKFYPNPVIEEQLPTDSPKAHFRNLSMGYLTKDDFVEAYDKCNEIMHARNPYKVPLDYSKFRADCGVWREKIRLLLNSHQLFLLNEPGFYLIHMKEDRDDKVHYYLFKPPPV
jgi:hypothetical protein